MSRRSLFFFCVVFTFAVGAVLAGAHEGEEDEQYNHAGQNLIYYKARTLSTKLLITATIIIAAFVAYALAKDHHALTNKEKKILFAGIAVPAILATVVLAYATVYLNVTSQTKGPVHWHADYEIWKCGEKLDLKNPEGFTNRIGTPVFHEHGDARIHVEGVLIDKNDANLERFFNVTGGLLAQKKMRVPTDTELVEAVNGEPCGGANEPGKLQVFLLQVTNPDQSKQWVYEQKKLDHFDDYVLAPYSYVPPGDCIIIEFGEEKETTDKICESYTTAIKRGELRGR